MESSTSYSELNSLYANLNFREFILGCPKLSTPLLQLLSHSVHSFHDTSAPPKLMFMEPYPAGIMPLRSSISFARQEIKTISNTVFAFAP